MRRGRIAALLAAGLACGACGEDGGGATSPDAATVVGGPDAGRADPDAVLIDADAGPGDSDAALGDPDAGPADPDAGGDADAAAPPDAAPPPPLPPLAFNEIDCRGEEWIELVNAGDTPIDLTGWTLTDDPADPARARALAGALAPNAFALVEALPFGIGCGDETLHLLAPDGRAGDTVADFDPPRGSTWGRLPDGAGPWQVTRPTPGAPNAAPGTPVVRLNEVDCHGREWVELVNVGDGAADLTGWVLTDDLEDAEIAHPLDFVLDPGEIRQVEQQTRREDGFRFGIACGADVVRLVDPQGAVVDEVLMGEAPAAFSWGRLPDGEGDWTATDKTAEAPNRPPTAPAGSLFDPDRPFQVDLTLDPAALDALAAQPREYVPATMQMTVGDEVVGPIPVGIHIKGRAGSFRTMDRKPAFKVKIDFTDDEQRLFGLKKLTFNNQVQDPSLIHEFAAYSIFREAGVPAPRVGYAFLRINGAVYGLYAHIETYDDVMLDRHFASTQHLFEGAYGQDLFHAHVAQLDPDEGDAEDRSDLQAITTLMEAPPPEGFYAATQHLVNWPLVLRTMAAEVWIGHWDGYAPTRNNYYFHFDEGGRLSLMPWGTDQTFASHLGWYDGRGRMLEACRLDRQCLAAYERALDEVDAAVDRLPLEERITELTATLAPWSAQDVRREYDANHIAQSVQATLAFLERRRADAGALLACLNGPDADRDGDGFPCTRDCSNDDPDVYPGAPETCGDNVDNDCSGVPDDALECPDCREVWRGAHRYLVCPTPRPFADVAQHCLNAGAAPLIIDAANENAWILAQAMAVRRQSYWIPLTDVATEGRFVWHDGSAPAFTSWNGGEPNNAGNEDCTQSLDGGRWNDVPCGHRYGVICEDPCPAGLDEDGDGFGRCGPDCDDGNPAAHPGAPEICRNGVDEDCSGVPDDGCP